MIDVRDIETISIEATSYCNLHCPQCDRFDRSGYLNKYMKLDHLDFNKIKKNLNLDKLISLKKVRLEGDHGDPAMHPDIKNFLELNFRNV